jgi:Protein of unknown function (DUF3489)
MIHTVKGAPPNVFAIDRDNGIRFVPESTTLATGESEFSSLNDLTAISQSRNWSKEDVTEVWNSFAGTPEFADLKSQKQFKNRGYGLQKIWDAIQRLAEPEHEPLRYGFPSGFRLNTAIGKLDYRQSPPRTTPEESTKSENPAPVKTKPKKTPKPKASTPRKTVTKAEKTPKAVRAHTKRDEVVRLISRANGATQSEIMEKMGWQVHTVRGFISTLGSKHGIKVISVKTENKGLVYSVA